MTEVLIGALNPVIIIFLVSSMLACGLSLTLTRIFGPFRDVRLTISAAVGNYILVPLIAIVVSRIIGIEQPFREGLVLLAMTAGTEAGPKLTTNAKGNVGFSVGLLVVSLGITMFYVPMMLSVLLPEVHLERGRLMSELSLTLATPIIVGLFMKARYEAFADRLVKYVHKVSSIFLLLAVFLIIVLNYGQMFRLFGSGAPLAAAIFIIISFITGYLLGGPERGTRLAMAFMHAARNYSLALMIASQVFADQPKVLMMMTVTVILMLLLLLPSSIYLGRRTT